MNKEISNERRGLLFTAVVALVFLAVIAFMPRTPKTQAVNKKQPYNHTGADGVTRSENPNLPYYDVRLEDDENAKQAMQASREKSGKALTNLIAVKQEMRNGEAALRQRVPTLKVEYNDDLRVPEVIGTDVLTRTALAETGIPAVKKHAEAVRSFLRSNNSLIGLGDSQIDSLKVIADYTNPDGNLSYVDLGQEINGVPVFRGEIRAAITKDGQIFRMINNLAPGLDYQSLSAEFGRPEDAVFVAARYIDREATADDVKVTGTKHNGNMTEFAPGQFDWPTLAEKMYFPTEPGVAVPAWRVLFWEPVAAYYVVIDTEGRLLWRKNLTNDQTQAATYNVYNSDSPAPSSPTTALPGANFQAPAIPRVSFTLIGNEAPNPGMNNLGWITDGTNGVNGHTDGNNVEAGLDRVAPNGVDAPVPGTNRVFNFDYNPAPGNPGPGDDPLTVAFQNGMVVNMFYWTNIFHDRLYQVGFTEQARNYQNSNFGRGGLEGDRITIEGQDISGTNNANFSIAADGVRGRGQMFRFTGPTPNRDSGIDNDVLVHELAHGLSQRLIGNATGLGNNRGGSMGEGWSDFYARLLLSTADEDINGIYSTGGWVTLQFAGQAFTNNYYYGIRRFPYAVKTNLGGPMMRPHNPLTFADIDPAQINVTDGAFAPTTLPISTSATEVHNAGEIWCMALLEVRARIITRLGFATGNQRMLQLTTDGMKMTPTSPSFTQAKNAILAASQALGGSDTGDIWAGFATRGMGFLSSDSTANSVVVQTFDLPNAVVASSGFSVSDAPGDNDGFPEPGENVLLTVPVVNNTGNTVNNVMATVTGGGSANYGNIANGATETRQIAYTVPSGAACGGLHQVSITVTTDIGSQAAVTREFRLGAPVGGAPVTFSNSTVTNLPNGQPATTSGPAAPYPSNITVSGLTGNKLITLEITGITHTFPGDLDMLLVGPGGQKYIFLSDSGSTGDVSNLTFSLNDAAAAQPSTTQWVAGTFRPYNTGANDLFDPPAPAGPYTNAAPAGTDTFTSVFGTTGSAMNGTWSLYIDDDAGGDFGTMAGWKLTFEANDYACSVGNGNNKPIADFDGDNKTDASIFRTGTWWINKSMGGTSTLPFGNTTDMLVPNDYDADNKADIAVFRDGVWYILNSSNGAVQIFTWGIAGDTPVPADYDGDGDADAAVYRNGTWYVRSSTGGIQSAGNWGIAGDVPVRGDFDGDGKSDFAVRRITNVPVAGATDYFILYSNGSGSSTVRWGSSSYQSAIGDYNGDNKDDIGVAYTLSGNMIWAVKNADNTVQFDGAQWGSAGDIAVTGDYDGDGKYDMAIFRPSNATWYIRQSSNSTQTTIVWGISTDVLVPRSYQTP